MLFVPAPATRVLFGAWDVRVQDYRAYAAANRKVNLDWQKPGFIQAETCPVVRVSWNDAENFCAWLTEKERREGFIKASQSYRLPTDAEWSAAVGLNEPAGGTPREKDGQIKGVYPWGTSWPPPRDCGNYGEGLKVDKYPRTSPVGSFPPNSDGLYDMGGNVWQWCEDWYDLSQQARVLRGASWQDNSPDRPLSSYRHSTAPGTRDNHCGFRCVLAVEP
jgi:formylglycine-generating enzyme required for sulfatase activity